METAKEINKSKESASLIPPPAIPGAPPTPEQTKQVAKAVAIAIPPCPGGRTASIDYLNWASQFTDDARFAELYASRKEELIERFTGHPDIGLLVIDRLKAIK